MVYFPYFHRMKNIVLFLLLPLFALSQGNCSDPGFRDFDFWIGDWVVYNGENIVGHSSIKPILDSCVIEETWSGASGSNGKSFNSYFPEREEWEQTWVDNSGSTIHFTGKLINGNMVMHAQNLRGNSPVYYEMTYFPKANGNVQQVWKQSSDEKKTWIVLFDGLYKRR